MIIIEGPDGSGKSTLVDKLSRHLKLPVAPRVVGSDTKPLLNLRQWTEENISKGFQPVIFDRHRLISEPIYGPAIKRRQNAEFYDLGWLSDMMWRFYQAQPVIIYCLPDIQLVYDNVHREETNNAAVKDHIGAIYAGYVARASMDFTRGVGRLYNYKVTRLDDIMGWVNWKLEERNLINGRRVQLPQQRSAEAVHPRSDDNGRSASARRHPH